MDDLTCRVNFVVALKRGRELREDPKQLIHRRISQFFSKLEDDGFDVFMLDRVTINKESHAVEGRALLRGSSRRPRRLGADGVQVGGSK